MTSARWRLAAAGCAVSSYADFSRLRPAVTWQARQRDLARWVRKLEKPVGVLAWNPDTIVTTDAKFINTVATTVPWSQTDAVRNHRVFLSPTLPYGWVDAPPSINRLIGLQWLARLFFPNRFSENIRTVAKDFYQQFYQVDLSEADLDRLLAKAQD